MSILRHKRKSRIFRTPRFFRLFSRTTQATFCGGNRLELFRNGGDFFPALLQAIHDAKRSIHLEFYIIRNDRTGQLFAEALAAAAERGVEVRLLYDYIGCLDTPAAYFRHLEQEGVRCLPFNPPTFRRGLAWLDKRDHRKFVVFDGSSAFLGGLNIGDEYSGFGESLERWRDVGMRIDGPAVAELERLFWDSWQGEGGTVTADIQLAPAAPAGDAEVMIVSGGPHQTRSFIRSNFRMAIAGASESVGIITPYFVPGPRIVRSLLRAAGRGVKVQLILPSISDVPIIKHASHAFLTPLLKAGIEIYQRQETVLHAKVMLIDGCWATIGSANFDLRSFHRNYEVNVIVDDPEFGRQVDEMFTGDLARSRRLTLEEHEQRSWYERLLEQLSASLCWFL